MLDRGVDGPVRIEHLRGQLTEGTVGAGQRVVADEDVHATELLDGPAHHRIGYCGIGEVDGHVDQALVRGEPRLPHPFQHQLEVVGSPGLTLVVLPVVGDQQIGAHGGEPRGDGAPDPLPPAHAGDDGDPAPQRSLALPGHRSLHEDKVCGDSPPARRLPARIPPNDAVVHGFLEISVHSSVIGRPSPCRKLSLRGVVPRIDDGNTHG